MDNNHKLNQVVALIEAAMLNVISFLKQVSTAYII